MPPVIGPTWPIFTSMAAGAAGALAAGFCSPQAASATAAAITVNANFGCCIEPPESFWVVT